MEADNCIICKDSSEYLYRLKQAELNITDHKVDVSQELGEMKEEMEKMEDKIFSRFNRLEGAIWGIVIGFLFVLLDTILGKV